MKHESLPSLSPGALVEVAGGFTKSQIPTIEHNAVRYATRKLGGGPVFLGNVNNDTPHQKVFTRKGVLVSTGDEANTQFYVGRVLIDRAGHPTGMKDL
jgi:hypothetical protein